MSWIEEFLHNPAVGWLHPTPASMDQTPRWMRQFCLGRKRILDTQLAAVLHGNGAYRLFTTNPKDFAVFGGLQKATC